MRLRPRTFLLNALSALPLIVALHGCALWHEVGKEDLSRYLEREKPGKVRISLADSTLVLTRPVLHRDSLLGLVRESRSPQYAAVPVADIQKMETRTFRGSPSGKMAASVLGGLLVGVLVTVLIFSTPRHTNP